MDKKLEQLFFAALGGAMTLKEKLEVSSEELKAWQSHNEAKARECFDELAKRGEEEQDQFRQMLKQVLHELVEDLDLVTKSDLEKFRQELER